MSVAYQVVEEVEVEAVTLRAAVLDVLDRFHGGALAVSLLGDGSVIEDITLGREVVAFGACPFCGAADARTWVEVESLDGLYGGHGQVVCDECGNHSGDFYDER